MAAAAHTAATARRSRGSWGARATTTTRLLGDAGSPLLPAFASSS